MRLNACNLFSYTPRYVSGGDRSERDTHGNGGALTDSGIDLHGIGILLHVGKTHARTEAEIPDIQ